ncbi:hypothetical protein D3C76_1043320 [compost metagenome]
MPSAILGAQDPAIVADRQQALYVERHHGGQGHLALRFDYRLLPTDALVIAEQNAAALAYRQHARAKVEQGIDLHPVGTQRFIGGCGLRARQEGKDDGQPDDQADQVADHRAHGRRS